MISYPQAVTSWGLEDQERHWRTRTGGCRPPAILQFKMLKMNSGTWQQKQKRSQKEGVLDIYGPNRAGAGGHWCCINKGETAPRLLLIVQPSTRITRRMQLPRGNVKFSCIHRTVMFPKERVLTPPDLAYLASSGTHSPPPLILALYKEMLSHDVYPGNRVCTLIVVFITVRNITGSERQRLLSLLLTKHCIKECSALFPTAFPFCLEAGAPNYLDSPGP